MAAEFSASLQELTQGDEAVKNIGKIIKACSRALLMWLPIAAKEGYTEQHLSQAASEASLPADLSTVFVRTLSTTLSQIRQQMIISGTASSLAGSCLENDNASMPLLKVNEIISLNWTFGVTASTSSLKSVGRTFLQLKLKLKDSEGSGVRDVVMEMDVKGLYRLLGEMERAKGVMDSIEG